MKLLLLVNSSASSVTARARVVIQKALSADHDVTLAETSRRGHATRLAQGAAADGVDVVVVLGGDGTLNEAANGLAGTDDRPRRAARRLDQRLRPHHRHAQRPDRGHRRAARRAGARSSTGASASARSTAATSSSTSAWASTPPSWSRSSGAARSSATPATRSSSGPRVRHLVPPLRPQPAPASPCSSPTGAIVDDGYFAHLPQHQPVHVPRQPAVQRRPRGRRSTAAS